MKTWNKTISLLCNDEQQIVANGYPDLRVNGVLGCSVEGLNMQMLFDPFEEHLIHDFGIVDLARSKQNE